MKTQTIGWLLLVVVGCRAQSATWEELSSKATQAGLDAAQVEPILARCRERGWDPEATQNAMRFAINASREGVPCDPILARIEEGITKGVEPERVAEVAQQRYTSLARADQLLHETLGESVPGHGGIVLSLSRALESGLTDESMAELLRAGENTRPGPMMAILDAGELLRHAGFSETDSLALMNDCLERDAGRQQIMRFSQLACEKKKAGIDTAHIREELSKTPTSSGDGRRRGQGRNR